MYAAAQLHTLDSLTDSTLPGCCPQEPVSTWTVDLVGHVEATGIYAETLDHNRDLAKGLLDPEQGYRSQEDFDDERVYADALMIARQGGERVYEQEQGFAPLVLEVGLRRDGTPNAAAMAAAWLDDRSPATDLDMPELSQSRRHWRDIGPEEQASHVSPFDAETHGLPDADALVGQVNDPESMREGGISPTFALDGVTVEDLTDALGEQGAANYLGHLYAMVEHQLAVVEQASEHARAAVGRNPVCREPDINGRWHSVYLRKVPRSHPTYRMVTAPWRQRNQARVAAWDARGWDGTVNYDPSMPPVPVPTVKPADVRTHVRVVSQRTTCPSHPKWWVAHGDRIYEQILAWNALGRRLEDDEVNDDQVADDAYYVLKFA